MPDTKRKPRGNHHHQATSQATPQSGSTSSAAGQSAIAHAARRTDRKMYNDQKRGGVNAESKESNICELCPTNQLT